MIPYNKRVTRLLELKGMVEPQKLQDAAAKADERGAMISSVLLEMKLVDDRALLGAIAEQTKVPPIDLRVVAPDPTLLQSFPQEMAFEHRILPISRIGDVLTLAVTN